MSPTAALLFLLLATPAQQSIGVPGSEPSAKPPPQNSGSETQVVATDELPVSLSRIQRALSSPSAIKLLEPRMRNGRPVYRVDVEGEKIDIRTLLAKDALRGAVPYGGMTHQEFLDMVTPDDVRGYAAFSNAQGITVAATSIALQWAVLKAIDVLKKAKDAREQEAAQKGSRGGARSAAESPSRGRITREIAERPLPRCCSPAMPLDRRSSPAESTGSNPPTCRNCAVYRPIGGFRRKRRSAEVGPGVS